jgi:hypothetical protein
MRTKYVLSVLAPAALILHLGTARATVCGDAYFNHDIDFPNTGNLYYTVAGAPANTCGDLYADRNGSGFQLNAAGWICTDGSGTATKGPWTYAGQADDETANVYIDWGSCTSPVRNHIWDIDGPVATITTSAPSDFAGYAQDDTWGAGFDNSWTYCYGTYYDQTANRYWDLSTYSDTSEDFVTCSYSGASGPGDMFLTWSTTSAQRPEVSDHQSGHHYVWKIWIWDGGHWGTETTEFTY